MSLYKFIIFFGTSIILITFFVAVAFLKTEKPNYFKYIFAFVLFGLFISLNTILHTNFGIGRNIIMYAIERVFTLFQFFALGLFFTQLLNKSLYARKIKLLFYISTFIGIILIPIAVLAKAFIYTQIATNLVLIVFCVFYFRDLLNTKPTLILIKSSAFWIVTGIFFVCCISFPIYSLQPFIASNHEYKIVIRKIFSISNMALIVLYFFIIKSYLCLKHPQNL